MENYVAFVVSDNCSYNILQTNGPTQPVFLPLGTTYFSYSVIDVGGNTVLCDLNVTIVDGEAPIISTCPPFITVNTSSDGTGDCSALIPNMIPDLVAMDNCSTFPTDITVTQMPPAGTVISGSGNGDTQFMVFIVTDAVGNTSTCFSRVTLFDDELPTISCDPTVRTVNTLPGTCSYTTPFNSPEFYPSVIADNCGAGIQSTAFNGVNTGISVFDYIFPVGTTIVTYVIGDFAGNTSSCSLSVVVVDNQPPTLINCPANITVGNDVAKCGSNVTFAPPIGTDNCDFTLTQPAGLPSGGLFPVGITTVTFVAADNATPANTVSCNFTITVMDMQPPTAVCQNIVVDLNASGAVTITPAQVKGGTTDNCPTTLTYVISETDFDCTEVGQNNVTLTITDGASNTSTCVSTVTVRDVTPPTFTCPAAITVEGCNGSVPDLVTGITTEADNCGVASTVQNPLPGLAFGNIQNGSTSIIVTVTDVNGNITTCTVSVTIIDDNEPDFLSCPTQMIMIGNDPDQCSGKVNWIPPVAVDDCVPLPISAPGIPIPGTVVQTGGPLSGTTIPITCPPTPITITYVATDAAGNQSTCSFQVMVVDTEKPELDADIIMPNDTLVNCHQLPTNCVYHGPSVCAPLTNSDVNDNCTSPSNISISYAELSTQNPNPALCAHYTYNLTRTWTVSDCAGNMLKHTQMIQVQDTTKPTAICKNIALVLDKTGKVSIVPADINNGSFDNCASASVLTYEIIGLTTFTCANLGTNTITLKVTDPCGNFSTCSSVVTVSEGIAPCTPQYFVMTSCLDNATDENNGQFLEMITIKALAMQTWRIATNVNSNGVGFYLNAGNPPATPVLIPVGTAFTAGTADGIDNDGDAAIDEADEMIYYTLKGRFTECKGYDISVSNAGSIGIGVGATTTTISNKACYPNPYFLNMNDPFCLNTPPFTIEVGEYNNAAGNIVPGSVMVNGVATTIFDATALGLGFHTIMATFDAGSATNTLTINGVLQPGSGTMNDAVADPGCKQKIAKVVQIVDTPSQLVCDDLVHVSLDETCMHFLTPDDVLEGSYFCYDDYTVELDKVLPYGNGPWVSGQLTGADIGKTYYYRVVHASGGNICWGQVKIEDKLAPKLTCPPNIDLICVQNPFDLTVTGQVQYTDCSQVLVEYNDALQDFSCAANPTLRLRVTRSWIVTDIWGNSATCSQVISVNRGEVSDVIFPINQTYTCDVAPPNLNPDNTGWPRLNGLNITTDGTALCGLTITYEDETGSECPGNTSIIRTWRITDFCPIGGGAPINVTHIQYINVNDVPPVIDFSGFTYDPINNWYIIPTNTNVLGQCVTTGHLPVASITDACNEIVFITVATPVGNTTNGGLIPAPGLGIGEYNVTYTVMDACGNVNIKQIRIAVRDVEPPTVVCDQVTKVGLNVGGFAQMLASSVNSGTFDNCCIDSLMIRRMNSQCGASNDFGPSVQFCCSDIGDSVRVIFRVTDCYGNTSECMVQVLVEDKVKPICTPPAHVTVSCELFDESLSNYGNVIASDNCCLDTTTLTINKTNFDTVCNRGTIVRTFRVFDCGGQESQCSQRLVVTYEQDYYVKFPNDRIITVCDGTGIYGQPEFFGEDCELLGISFEDLIFTVVPDACFKIERTWTVINWCTFNTNVDCIYVPNPNPSNTTNAPANLLGPTVSPLGTPAPWAPTNVKINPTDPLATNYSTFYNQNANCYRYKQIIKIIDTEDPVAQCPDTTVVFCDVTANSTDLWKADYWWDATMMSHDLCEGPTDLSILATDSCSGANINIEYELFLDTDQDGVMETVIASTSLPGFNWIYVGNNDGNADLTDGTQRSFDERAVPSNQKYGFVIFEKTVGMSKQAFVRWNTIQNMASLNPPESTFTIPELPYGTHKIKWLISDGCGNDVVCDYQFKVKDCKAPTLVCLDLNTNIMPNGMTLPFWAADFIQYAEDNCTPSQQLQYAIRVSGTGTGFPTNSDGTPQTSVQFDCDHQGEQTLEIWAMDAAGNADFCEATLTVQDNNQNCDDVLSVAGQLATETNDGLEEAGVEFTGSHPALPPVNLFDLTDVQGDYIFSNVLPVSGNYMISPIEDENYLNGVSTYDLVLISKHILGIEPLTSPYKQIAADANRSGSITTFDIVELRRLILGIYTDFPNNTSWRFVDKAFIFNDPLNPFGSAFPETISVSNAQNGSFDEDFVAIKIGDVNNSAQANALMNVEDRTTGTLLFDINDQEVKSGNLYTVKFTATEIVKGYQFTLKYKGLEVIDITPISEGMSMANFGQFADAITTSFNGGGEESMFEVRFRAVNSGKLSQMFSVSSTITRAEAYSNSGKKSVALRFKGINGIMVQGVGFELYQNTPNPFVSKTQIGFHLPYAASATLRIFDEMGRIVHQQTGVYSKGMNTISIDKALANAKGVLYYTLQTDRDSATKKMIRVD